MRKPAQGRKFASGGVGVTVRLPEHILERCIKLAASQDRTLSAVCRRMIVRGLPAEEAKGET